MGGGEEEWGSESGENSLCGHHGHGPKLGGVGGGDPTALKFLPRHPETHDGAFS